MKIGELIREGKGKRVYATDDKDLAVVYFKDEAIAYQGLKRGRILGKGEINNAICQHLFTLLAQQGVDNHFVRKVDARQSLVKKVDIIPVALKVRNIVAGSLVGRIGYPEGTHLANTVFEFDLKNDELENPLVNHTHITAMGLATLEELEAMCEMGQRVNDILTAYMNDINVELIDIKLEFGRFEGKLMLADEISPDTCRFWDANTHEALGIDRFRRDLGDVEQAYEELLSRMMGPEE